MFPRSLPHGHIVQVARLGAFHGKDDSFYQNVYKAKLWAFPQMDFSHGEKIDHNLSTEKAPISNAKIIEFKTTRFKEALLLINKSGGILISCDSIKNWQRKDSFFDDATFEIMKNTGSIGKANIDAIWLSAMRPSRQELKDISSLEFSILLSAHGEPLTDDAKNAVNASILKAITFLENQYR